MVSPEANRLNVHGFLLAISIGIERVQHPIEEFGTYIRKEPPENGVLVYNELQERYLPKTRSGYPILGVPIYVITFETNDIMIHRILRDPNPTTLGIFIQEYNHYSQGVKPVIGVFRERTKITNVQLIYVPEQEKKSTAPLPSLE